LGFDLEEIDDGFIDLPMSFALQTTGISESSLGKKRKENKQKAVHDSSKFQMI
jgi:hypothetical protein